MTGRHLPGQRPRLTPVQAAEVAAWYAARKALPTVAQMCARYGISDTTLYMYGRDPYRKHHRGR